MNIQLEEKILFNTYEKELEILKDLFSKDYVSNKLDRIEEIYNTSEKFWEEQLTSLPEDGIKYLLIAEAPPWSPEGEVTYVYNPKSKPRTLLRELCKAFLGEPLYKEIGTEETLKRLAAFGLIIIDSLPFAMNYKSKRYSKKYSELLAHTVNSYMLKKINREDLKWSNDLKIAFAFKINGLTIINALKDGLSIQKLDKSFSLSENLIVANAAGYPDSKKLKEVFGI